MIAPWASSTLDGSRRFPAHGPSGQRRGGRNRPSTVSSHLSDGAGPAAASLWGGAAGDLPMPVRTKILPRALLCGSAALLAAAGGAQAHHSYAVFDRSKTITIEGTVYAWEMVNPHSFLWVS